MPIPLGYRGRVDWDIGEGLKRVVPSSISSRTHKHFWKNTNKHPSQGPGILPGTSNQGQMRRFSPTKEESRREARVQSNRPDRSRQQEPLQRAQRTTRGAEEYWDRQFTTVQPQEKEPQEKEPQHGSLRRRSGR
ncbi:hypothetical protein TNCV_2169451 [Trichonephila clavipes]|nr:hypothetical protein TNCV_2169451 [Trichonephila clavipes]